MEKLSYEELQAENAKLQRQIQYYRQYDPLTGIYNKVAFYQKVKENLADNSQFFNIVCVDVERFRVVNDLFGTSMGNELLIYLAKGIGKTFSTEALVYARLSADVFGILLPASVSFHEIEQNMLKIFKEAPLEMEMIPAIGIYQVNDKNLPVEQMCDRAMMALESIKGNYLMHFAVYRERLRENLLEEQELLSRADFALENHEFEVYVQPKCNMKSGKLVGGEALVRWNHPQKGMIAPGIFIPLFERNGFVKKLDLYVWEETVKWIRSWIDKGHCPVPVSVNVSRIDIIRLDLFKTLEGILKKYDVSPGLLEVEITESAYTSRFEEIIVTVENLMSSGYTVLMDDFGSGYSSLNMLKDINVNILKLDLHFLDNSDKKSRDILESIVYMARWLNLKVIAEGVETKSQVEFLLDIGCEFAQGYYYYCPMPLSDFEEILLQEGKVDYQGFEFSQGIKENMIKFKDLFHEDMMTELLLNNIIGAIALLQYDEKENTLKIFRCNSEYYWLVYQGEKPVEAEEQNVLELIMEEDRPIFMKALQEAKIRGERGVEFNVRRQHMGNVFRWHQIRLFYLSDRNGQSLYYGGIQDVTEQMRNMEELKTSERQFRLAMEASGNTLFELDIESRIASFAKHSQEEFGLIDCVANAPEGFIEQGSVCEGYEDLFRDMYEHIYGGADKAGCVIQANMGDGSIVWNRITLIAVKNDEGISIKAVGIVENVTNEILLKEKLEQLQCQEQR